MPARRSTPTSSRTEASPDRGGLPRANAVKHVHEKHGVNLLSCICAIDRATLPPLMEYWVPEVKVSGVHELVGNALVMKGEQERTTDLRGEPLVEPLVEAAGNVTVWVPNAVKSVPLVPLPVKRSTTSALTPVSRLPPGRLKTRSILKAVDSSVVALLAKSNAKVA